MRQATLLYNPAAGKGRITSHLLQSLTSALQQQGVATELLATTSPGSAAQQAAEAAQRSEILFACGGDGTVHEVIQGLVQQPATTLGIIPLGSANVLARHLKLSLDPLRAARQQLGRTGSLVPLGKITYQTSAGEQSRHFASLAGAGADGLLVYKALAQPKQRLGRFAYYLRAARLLACNHFSTFQLEYTLENGETATSLSVTVMTSRVDSLGGLFRPLVRGGAIHHTHLSLTSIRPPSLCSMPAWFAMSWAGLAPWNRWQDHLRVRSLRCGEGTQGPVQVQADGEWLGQTPMRLSLVPAAIRLFLPPAPTSRPVHRSQATPAPEPAPAAPPLL